MVGGWGGAEGGTALFETRDVDYRPAPFTVFQTTCHAVGKEESTEVKNQVLESNCLGSNPSSAAHH